MHPGYGSGMQLRHRHHDQRDRIRPRFRRPLLCDEPAIRSMVADILSDDQLPEVENLHPGLAASTT